MSDSSAGRRKVSGLLANAPLPASEARALLAHALGTSRESLIASPEREVDDSAAARFARDAERRRAGEPLAYLLGEKEFYGRRFEVKPAVLIPRPETELLIDAARQLLHARAAFEAAPRVLDLGTGSGCIAVTLALEWPRARVTAVDASIEALAVADRNARRLGAHVTFHRGDWFRVPAASGAGFAANAWRFDLIVSNPPYVADGDPHLAELQHEPQAALVAGADGLDALRAIVADAPGHLLPGGSLLVEHGYDQGAAVRGLFEQAGFEAVETLRDASGHERACSGQMAG